MKALSRLAETPRLQDHILFYRVRERDKKRYLLATINVWNFSKRLKIILARELGLTIF